MSFYLSNSCWCSICSLVRSSIVSQHVTSDSSVSSDHTEGRDSTSTHSILDADRDALYVCTECLRLVNDWANKVLSTVAYKRAHWFANNNNNSNNSDTNNVEETELKKKRIKNKSENIHASMSRSSSNTRHSTSSFSSSPSSSSSVPPILSHEDSVSIIHISHSLKSLSSHFIRHSQHWLNTNTRAIINELRQFIQTVLLQTILPKIKKKKNGRVMHDLIGRIIGAVESITTTNSPSLQKSSTVNATTTTTSNDDSFVSPSRLYPVLLAVQCLLWELITTATINNSSSNSNTNSNTIVTSNNNTASNASSSSLFLSMSSTMNIITQQSVVALFSFMQRIDAFISLLDLERNFVNAASMHDLWMREMYIEKRYGSTQGNTNID